MKQAFIAVRHGEIDKQRKVTKKGEDQIRLVADGIRKILSENDTELEIYLISSTAPRAVDSSQILITSLNIPPERIAYHDSFWEDDEHGGNQPLTRQMVDDVLTDGHLVIVVGHFASLVGLVFHVCMRYHAPCSLPDIHAGEALLVNQDGVVRVPEDIQP